MDQPNLKVIDSVVDLEAGVTTSDEAQQDNNVSAANLGRNFFNKLCRGFVSADALVNGETGVNLGLSNGGVVFPDKVRLLIDEKVQAEEVAKLKENKIRKDNRKTKSAKKAPKPPRPPRGLSLDAADQKLIQEIAQLAMMKRARMERLKALKRMKEAKASSSSSGNLLAMLFTVVFCLVILCQGVSSRSSTSSVGSPESARVVKDGALLIGNYWNPSTISTDVVSSLASNPAEPYTILNPENKGSREAI